MHKPVTIKEIARAMDVSVSTVSRALNDHSGIGLNTRRQVKKMAEKMKYQRNQNAVCFQKGKTLTIGVIVPGLSEGFFSSALSAIIDAASQRNYKVLVAQSHNNAKKEQELTAEMRSHRVDGLLVSVAGTASSFEHFEMLDESHIPVVFFDRVPPIPNIHYVSCNIEAGAAEAVNFLLKKGHRVIGMINGPDTLASGIEKREGYIKSMLKNRLKFDPSLIVNCDLSEEGMAEALNKLMFGKRKPTAVVTCNDDVFLYAANYARKQRFLFNPEPEFVSFSSLPMVNFIDSPPAASVEQFPGIQAQKATDILLDLLADGNRKQQAFYQVSIEPKLIKRNVSGLYTSDEPFIARY